MNVSSSDLLQFHWWDYDNPYHMNALKYLSNLRDKGIIKYIGLTNFDTERMQIMIDSKLKIVSNQVQYSIIDRRPESHFVCQSAATELGTLSLQKYMNMIEAWDGWNLFQHLLLTLRRIAQKHDVSIANVATNYILAKTTGPLLSVLDLE